MEYSFNLEWDELDDDLKQQKIDEVIEQNYEDGQYETEIEGQPIHLDTYLDDPKTRNRVESRIATRFPIYF